MRFERGGQKYELPFKTPGYLDEVPQWLPQELPLTWKNGEVEATLAGLGLKWNEQSTYKNFA